MEGMIDGIVAVLPGKFLKSLRNHTSHQVGGLFGGTLVVRFDITELLGFVQDARDVMVLFGVVVVCSSSGRAHCRELTPVCHDCLVVNGTSKLIINISSRHGC